MVIPCNGSVKAGLVSDQNHFQQSADLTEALCGVCDKSKGTEKTEKAEKAKRQKRQKRQKDGPEKKMEAEKTNKDGARKKDGGRTIH